MLLTQLILSTFFIAQCTSQLVPGTLDFCDYIRRLGRSDPRCPITTQTPVFTTPFVPTPPPSLATCVANAALVQCTSDAFACPISRTICTQSNNNRCCQGTNPGIPVSDINAKAGSCPAPLGISTAQDVTVGCWLDNNCPGIQKCCVEPNPVTNSASRVCRDPIGVSGTAICNAPLATGSCSSFVTRYYYDTAGGQCRPFQYSGCGGNSNNFNSLSICQATCGGIGVTGSSQCPADANIGLNCQFARPNACNTDADCIGRINTIQPTCCVTTCGYKICYQNY